MNNDKAFIDEYNMHRSMSKKYLSIFKNGIGYRHDLPLHRQPKVLVNYHINVANEMLKKNRILSKEEKRIIFSETLYEPTADYVDKYVRKPGGWDK